MSRNTNLSLGMLAAGIALAFAAPSIAAEEKAPPPDKKRAAAPAKKAKPADVRVEAGKASMDYSKTPMRDVVFGLQRATGLNIVLHPDLQKANPVITLKVNNMRLGSALHWICELADATYVLQDQAIFIVPKSWRRKQRTTVTVDVRDMISSVTHFPGPTLTLQPQIDASNTPIILTDTPDPEPAMDGGDLADLVQRSMQVKGEKVSVELRNGHLVITTGEDF